MKKRIISAITIIFMLTSILNFIVYPSERVAQNSKVDILKGLDIVCGYEEADDVTMKKATYINFLMNMVYENKFGGAYDTSALELAEGMGIIDNAGSVSEDAVLKSDEAIKMSMCLLGYKQMCMETGGYPTGFINNAITTGLIKNLTLDKELTNEQAYNLLYNTMETEVARLTAVTSFGEKYDISKDKTILNVYRKIYKAEGVVTANSVSGLYSSGTAPSGKVMIEEDLYEDKGGILFNYLGYKVNAFVKEVSDGEYEVIYGQLHKDVETKEIYGENVVSVSDDLKTIEFYEDSESKRTTKEVFSGSVSLLYNNVVYSDYKKEDFKNTDSKILLIDNDGDGYADVIKLDAFETMIVSSKSASSNVITGEYAYNGALTKIDLEEYRKNHSKAVIYYEGNEVTINEIQTGDVLSVLKSKGTENKSIEIYISRNKLTATVTNVNETEKEVIAGDIIYNVSDAYFTANKEGEAFAEDIAAGNTYVLYFDINNKIAGAKIEIGDGVRYGYVRLVNEKYGLESVFELRILESTGEWKTYKLANKVRLKGNSPKKPTFDEIKASEGDLVGFTLNAEGEINRLELPVKYEKGISDERLSRVSEVTNPYRYNSTSFDNRYHMTGATKVFLVPYEMEGQTVDLTDETLYSIGNSYSFTADKTYSNLSVYNPDEYHFVNYVLLKQNITDTKAPANTNYFVREVTSIINAEGVATKQIIVSTPAYLGLSLVASNSDVLNGVSAGDIVRVHMNADGYVDNVTQTYKISEGAVNAIDAKLQDAVASIKGTFKKADVKNGRILLDSTEEIALKVSATTTVMIFDATKEDISVGTIADLGMEDYIIADISRSAVKGLYVIRNLKK